MARRIKEALPGDIHLVDVHVRTPSEFDRWRDDPGTIDWMISREGIVVYPVGADTTEIRPKKVVREGGPPPESVKGWLQRAEQDVAAVEQLCTQDPALWGIICFHAQQAAEKYLKALVVNHNVYPPRIHDLTELLGRARRTGARLEGLESGSRSCRLDARHRGCRARGTRASALNPRSGRLRPENPT